MITPLTHSGEAGERELLRSYRNLLQWRPWSEPSTLETKIASLGSQHLVFEAIMAEYISKPTLVYIKFWDNDPQLPEAEEIPKRDYGNDYKQDSDVRCRVENYKTAFAPILASKDTMKLYKKLRPSISASTEPHTDQLSLYQRYRTTKEGEKPVDFHFLESFHCTNFAQPRPLRAIEWASGRPPRQWWPNIVVRMSEVRWAVREWMRDGRVGDYIWEV